MVVEEHLGLRRRAAVHAVLGDPHRLAMVDELALSDRSPSELGQRLAMRSNLVAHHVEVLAQVGLVERVTSIGDRRRKYLRLRPGPLAELARPVGLSAGCVVFVCTGNSARSQLAAGLWNARSAVSAVSAGTAPAQRVHPEAIAAAARAGLDLSAARPRPLTPEDAAADLVVTVCDRAHERAALLRGRPVLHWSVADPAADGTPAAFDQVLGQLRDRVESLAPLVAPSLN